MITNPKKSHYADLSVLCDVISITLSYCLTYLFRFSSGLIPMRGDAPSFSVYATVIFIVIPVFLFMFRAYGLYDGHRRIRRVEEIFQVVKAVTFSVLLLTAMSFFYRGLSYSRVYLLIFWVFSILLISFTRYMLIQWEYKRKLDRKEIARVLLIGANRNARQIVQWARHNPHYGQEIVAILARDPAMVDKHIDGIDVVGVSEECEAFIEKLKPDVVVLADPTVDRQRITELVIACEDKFIEFKVVADVYGLMTRHVNVEYISSVPLLGFKHLPLDDPWNRAAKRSFDFIVSLILIVVSLPFWIVVTLLVKLDRGPVFYSQERVGRDHKTFQVLKFRTMKQNAEAETGPVWAKANDDRRTLMGNWLRRWNIDEIPQLLNVLKGEMSLVGPRPERPHFVDQFREDIPRYMARHRIKSGLTGWAQVNGYRGDTSIHERLKYDLYYMENWSLLFDIEILFMTFSAKAFKNAY